MESWAENSCLVDLRYSVYWLKKSRYPKSVLNLALAVSNPIYEVAELSASLRRFGLWGGARLVGGARLRAEGRFW